LPEKTERHDPGQTSIKTNMSEEDLKLIERYIAHEMSAEEAQAFERRLELDSDLHKETEAFQLALYAIRQEKKGELKQRFMTLEEVRKLNKGNTPNIRQMFSRIVISAAAIVLLFLIMKSTMGSYPEVISPQEQQQLFADHFSIYRDETMNPNVRGGEEDSSALFRFQQSFWNGQYEKALVQYDSLSAEQIKNDRLRFFKANILMANKKETEALAILEDLHHREGFIYADEVAWDLALIKISIGNLKEGIELLKQLKKSQSKETRDKAESLLKELRSKK
jgi:hypothetical protein